MVDQQYYIIKNELNEYGNFVCLSGTSIVESHLHLRPRISDRHSTFKRYSVNYSELNITSIISAAKEVKLVYPCGRVKEYLFIAAEDKESYSISTHFDEVFNFIERVREQGNILVHCILGVSRSVSLVLAYLIRKHSYSLEQALALIRRKRPIVHLSTYRPILIQVSSACFRNTAKNILKHSLTGLLQVFLGFGKLAEWID